MDQFELLQRATGFHAVPCPNIVERVGRYGNALLSRRPLAESTLHHLDFPAREPRGAIEVILAGDVPTATFVTTHLGLSHRERRIQIERLATAVTLRPGTRRARAI